MLQCECKTSLLLFGNYLTNMYYARRRARVVIIEAGTLADTRWQAKFILVFTDEAVPTIPTVVLHQTDKKKVITGTCACMFCFLVVLNNYKLFSCLYPCVMPANVFLFCMVNVRVCFVLLNRCICLVSFTWIILTTDALFQGLNSIAWFNIAFT